MSNSFRPPASGSGSGLTPEQLEALVTDPELASSLAPLLSAINTRASQEDVADLIAIVDFVDNRVAAVQTAVAEIPTEAAGGGAATPGEVRMMLTTDGSTPAGWERLPGFPLPNNQWAYASIISVPSRNIALNPLPPGGTSPPYFTTQNGYGQAYSAVHSDVLVFYAGQAAAGRAVRAFNLDTLTWRSCASFPYSQGVAGLVSLPNGDVAAVSGSGISGSSGVAAYRYSRDTDAWSALANRPVSQFQAVTLPTSAGGFVVIGGVSSYNGTQTAALRSAVRWNPADGTWTQLADVDTALRPYNPAVIGQARESNVFMARCSVSDGAAGATSLLLINPDTMALELVEAPPAGYFTNPVYVTAIFPGPDLGTFAVCSQQFPAGASCGLMYDTNKPAGSRWSALDLGDSADSGDYYASGFAQIPVGVSFAHQGRALAWQYSASSSTYNRYLPVLIDTYSPNRGPSAGFYARKLP